MNVVKRVCILCLLVAIAICAVGFASDADYFGAFTFVVQGIWLLVVLRLVRNGWTDGRRRTPRPRPAPAGDADWSRLRKENLARELAVQGFTDVATDGIPGTRQWWCLGGFAPVDVVRWAPPFPECGECGERVIDVWTRKEPRGDGAV